MSWWERLADGSSASTLDGDGHPVLGFFDESAASAEDSLSMQMGLHSARNTCTVLPSFDALEALWKRGALPSRVIVLPPLVGIRKDQKDEREAEGTEGRGLRGCSCGDVARNAGAVVPSVPFVLEDSPPLEAPDPLLIEPGDAWAARRIAEALEESPGPHYPATSHYRNLVWFGGAAYLTPEDARQKLDSIRANCSMFARMTLPTNALQIAERIVSLLKVCRDLMADED